MRRGRRRLQGPWGLGCRSAVVSVTWKKKTWEGGAYGGRSAIHGCGQHSGQLITRGYGGGDSVSRGGHQKSVSGGVVGG